MESNYESVQVVARHLPEDNGGPFTSIQDALAHGYDVLNPVTGFVQIGVMLDGAFIPLLSEKASLVHDAIEVAKANAVANDAPGSGTPGSGQAGGGEQPVQGQSGASAPQEGEQPPAPQG